MKEIEVYYKAYIQGLANAFKTYYRLRKSGQEFCRFVDEECPPFTMKGNKEVPLPLPVLLLVPLLRVFSYDTALRVNIFLSLPPFSSSLEAFCFLSPLSYPFSSPLSRSCS
jgi:hypothetical protein